MTATRARPVAGAGPACVLGRGDEKRDESGSGVTPIFSGRIPQIGDCGRSSSVAVQEIESHGSLPTGGRCKSVVTVTGGRGIFRNFCRAWGARISAGENGC